jgi:cation diffusion facilitator CzcD-associated flavoprotein CzcO
MDLEFRSTPEPKADFDVAILGAGFSGLCMGIALKKAGYKSFVILEKAGDLGGTWRDNHYPGCVCDVPSHLYAFSFEQNPDWSRHYPPQAEIWRYMHSCASKYGILPNIRFESAVNAAEFNEAGHHWRITCADGRTLTARAIVCGIGALHLPAIPAIEGLETFSGHTFHSSQWDDSIDLTGRAVGVIGTGASAIQIVPAIAAQAGALRLFQRTPAWVLPRNDSAYSERAKRLFRAVPGLQSLYRTLLYWRLEATAPAFLGNRGLAKKAAAMARAHLEKAIADPGMRAALTPDYTIGCKRILLSDDFYPALQRDNVTLVTQPVVRATPRGLVTADGREHALDILIHATGFRANEPLAELRVAGRGGHTLSHDWRYGAEAYYGMAVSGYPNFFMLLGPNSGLGHNSILFMIEAQARYIAHCLGWLLREGAQEVEVRRDVQRGFNARLKAKLGGTVWQSGCRSWYLNPNGSNSSIWPDYTFSYWWQTRQPDPHHFTFKLPQAPAPSLN